MRTADVDGMLVEWMSSYYNKYMLTEEKRFAERKRRADLGQFVMQKDAPGGTKQFRAFKNADVAYDFIVSKHPAERTFYETVFDVHEKQKPHFDLDIVTTPEDPMDHTELLNRLLTEIKRVVGPELDLVDDVGVYSSHAEDGSKRSYHVILTGYHVKNNVEAENFAKAIRAGMIAMTDSPASPEAQFIEKCVDLCVYKKLQQFRLLGCTKIGRNRHKSIVREYIAAGRTRTREPHEDPRVEFRRSLLTVFDGESKYLEPSIYNAKPIEKTEFSSFYDDADTLLRALCSQSRQRAFAAVSGEAMDTLWLKEPEEVIAHCLDAGHLPMELGESLRRQTASGDLVPLVCPPAGGYECVVCQRTHEHENPYLTLHEDWNSEASTTLCPRVVAIVYRCRRDPQSSVRICSMRGGGPTKMSEFTCLREPFDPRQNEKIVRPLPDGSGAMDV